MNRTTPRMTSRACMTAAIIGMTLAATQAQAVSITILNNSFEDPDIGADSFSETTPTDWTKAGGAFGGSVFMSDGSVFAGGGIAGAQDGDQYLLIGNADNVALHQDTSLDWSSLAVGDTLTIAAWTTYRNDQPLPTVYFWLNDDSNGGNSPLNSGPRDLSDGGSTAPGVWVERTWDVVITQADLDFAANNGWGTVNVQFGFVSGGLVDPQIGLDNVSLEYTPVPEPTSLALIALGGACLVRRRRS